MQWCLQKKHDKTSQYHPVAHSVCWTAGRTAPGSTPKFRSAKRPADLGVSHGHKGWMLRWWITIDCRGFWMLLWVFCIVLHWNEVRFLSIVGSSQPGKSGDGHVMLCFFSRKRENVTQFLDENPHQRIVMPPALRFFLVLRLDGTWVQNYPNFGQSSPMIISPSRTRCWFLCPRECIVLTTMGLVPLEDGLWC